MLRCRSCPSTQLRPIHCRPLDFALLLLAVRRHRCVYCQQIQWVCAVPAPIRWVMGILAVLLLYVLSVGPIDWLHATRRMSDASYQRVDNLIYGPVNELLESPETDDWAVSEAYASYRAWWSDSDEAATPTASSSLTQPNQDHSIHRQVNRNPVPSPDK